MSGGRRSAATGRDGKGTSRLDVVFEQLMTGALFDDPAQQFTQGLLLVGAQYAEDLRVRGQGVVDAPWQRRRALRR